MMLSDLLFSPFSGWTWEPETWAETRILGSKSETEAEDVDVKMQRTINMFWTHLQVCSYWSTCRTEPAVRDPTLLSAVSSITEGPPGSPSLSPCFRSIECQWRRADMQNSWALLTCSPQSLPPSFSHSSCQESQTHLGSRPRCLSPPARSGRDKCCQGFTKMAAFLGAPQAQPGPSITGRPYKHVASLRHHYSHITQRRISAAETGHRLWKRNEERRHLRLRVYENINLCDVNSFWCVI